MHDGNRNRNNKTNEWKWAGKMEASCPIGTTRCIPQGKFPRKSYNKSFDDRGCSVKMAGYEARFFCEFWISTSSRSKNKQRMKLVTIPPSWPHTWALTYICFNSSVLYKHVNHFPFLKYLFSLESQFLVCRSNFWSDKSTFASGSADNSLCVSRFNPRFSCSKQLGQQLSRALQPGW